MVLKLFLLSQWYTMNVNLEYQKSEIKRIKQPLLPSTYTFINDIL